MLFEKRMAELGYQQGPKFRIAIPFRRPALERILARPIASLPRSKVDIMLAAGNEPVLQAARGGRRASTPIVFIALDFDPVEKGYVESLSASRQQFHWAC